MDNKKIIREIREYISNPGNKNSVMDIIENNIHDIELNAQQKSEYVSAIMDEVFSEQYQMILSLYKKPSGCSDLLYLGDINPDIYIKWLVRVTDKENNNLAHYLIKTDLNKFSDEQELFERLVEFGINLEHENDYGETPYDIYEMGDEPCPKDDFVRRIYFDVEV